MGALGLMESMSGTARRPIRGVHIVVLNFLAEVWMVPGILPFGDVFSAWASYVRAWQYCELRREGRFPERFYQSGL